MGLNKIYQINSRAIDNAGNIQSSITPISFKFTNSPPVVSSVVASQGSDGIVDITYNVSDVESSGTTNYLFYGVESTLNGSISDVENSLTVSNGNNFPTSGTILVDDEIISYTSKTGNVLQGLIRGALSTTIFSHNTGVQVYIKANNVTGNGIGLSVIGSNKIINWSAKDDADGYYSNNGIVKVVANDGSTGSMIGSLSSSTFSLDVAKPLLNSSTLLINDSSSSVSSISPQVILKIQNVTGQPDNENIFVQFSKDAGVTWYGANENGTLSGAGTLGSGFVSSLANIGSISWPWTMQSRSETLAVRITDSFQNTSIEDVNTIEYNAPPEFNVDYPTIGAGGLSVSQILDSGDANFGKVKIQYSIRNIDTEGDIIPYFVTPSFSYDTGSGWNTILQGDITYGNIPSGGQVIDQNSDGLLDNKVSASSYYTYTVYWSVPNGIETEVGQFKVTLNDLGSNNNISNSTISSLVFDKKEPNGAVVTFDAGVAGSIGTGLVTIPLPTDVSAVSYRIQDDSTTNSSVNDTGWVSMTENTTIPWTFDIDAEAKTLKYQYRDIYGNTTNEIILTTLAPISGNSFLVQDASNSNIPSYDMYIGWEPVSSPTGFASYKLEYATSTDNSLYSSYSAVSGGGMSDTTTNYYVHRNLNSSLYYKYRLGVTGTDGNTSIRAGSPVTARPDGIQNFGEGGGGGGVVTASQIENVIPSQDSTTKDVTVTYRLTDGSLSRKISPSYEARLFYNVGITLPANAFSGGNLSVSDASKLKSSGYIQINNEVIYYSGKTGNILTGLTRGTWPTSPRATRQNSIFFQGTPVWIMASTISPTTIINSSISTGQNGSIVWTTYDETALAGGNYSNVGIRVLVHDNQSAGSGPLSTQSDYSEIGTLDSLDLTAPTIYFDSTFSDGSEDISSINIPLTLGRIYAINSTIDYTVTGTATGGGADFILANGTATITAGNQSTNINITVIDDLISESSENIILTLSNPIGATLGINTIYTYTIIDNDSDPSVGFTNTTGSGSENVTPVSIPISLSVISAKNTTIAYSIKNGGSAISGVDYILSSGTATITAGSTTTNISLAIIDDTLKEADETLIIELSSPTNSTLGVNTEFTYTITDNEPNLNVSFVSSSSSGLESVISEGINLTLSSVSSQDVSVDYTITGTATGGGTDFTLANGTATIIANTTTVEIPFTVVDDLLIESNETIIVTLSNPINASLGTKTIHTYTIINNDTDVTSPVVTLNGDSVISVIKGDSYTELGATVTDNIDTGLTATITGSVNTNLVGSYILTYTAIDSSNNIGTNTRTVNVVLALTYNIVSSAGEGGTIDPLGTTAVTSTFDQIYTITPSIGYGIDTLVVDGVNLAPALTYTFTNVIEAHTIAVTFSLDPDLTAPEITLIGDNPMIVVKGETYVEPGATALDLIDGPIIVEITGTVNNNTIGTYVVTYTATDSSNNKSTITRIVNVEYASTYTITSSSGSNGTIDPLGTTAVTSTFDQTYTITPVDGYKIATLVVDGANLVPESTYTFTNVIEAHTIAVTFSLIGGVPPTITILGDNPMTINTGDAFIDPGATAVDSATNEALIVTTAGTVNTSISGTYKITYFTSDSYGNTATEERTVNVIDITPPIISGIETPVKSASAAVIVWQTNEPSTSQVIWGTATGDLSRSTTVDEVLSVYHVVSLSSGTLDLNGNSNTLEPTTPYFFTVKSVDDYGNESESLENTFTTTADGQVIVVSSSSRNNNTSNVVLDTSAPVISNIKVSDITAFGATISFETNELAMSFVEYGKETTYGYTMGSSQWLTSHSIKLSGLRIGTDYHIRVTAVDKSGNSTTTEDEIFKTKYFSEVTADLKTIDNLEQFQAEIESTIESILPSLIPPFIEKPNIVNITENGAMVTYRTNIKAYPAVNFSTDEFYNKSKDKPYDGEISDTTTEKSLSHSLILSGLKANTKYHVMAKAFSLPQVVGQSNDIVFTTLPSKISGAIIDKKKDSFTVVWTTDEPTTSIVDYKNTITGRASRTMDNSQNTSHSIKIENLTPGTSYQVDISGVNKDGNIFEAASSLFVTTSVDITAPIINNVKVDSALVLGRTDRIQTIISWQTDEPSTSIVYYEEGSGILTKELSNKQEDLNTFTTNHSIVLTSLKPGTVYRFQVASTDSANNTVKPPIRTIITPRRTESIVDVIFKNFNETFNFINNFK
ncbi:MAG: DUF5011 domain-containing protein [Thermoplasmata archaeon]|nr:DUF5011 domain-containing protein [Thermoplasmata archaeon]